MASPIQVVLNPENYQEARETAGGGGRKDFFADRDNEFRIHRSSLISQIETISEVLSAQRQGDVGFAKVILRREAWAKSHRPVATLFRPDRTPVVGGGDLGVMLIEVRPSSLAQVSAEVAKAETNTRMKFNEFKQKELPHPSGQKSEAGAIDRIEMYGPSDRRGFSVEEAVAWLANPMTGSSYLVELFDSPPARSEWDRLDAGRRQLLESFIAGFAAFGQGLAVERLPSGRNRQPVLSVRLDQSTDQILRLSDTSQVDRRRSVATFNPDVDRHARLLSFLDHHPLVRRIELPGIVVRSDAPAAPSARIRPTGLAVPIRDSRRTHPRIGIIDGGISDALSDWVIDRWDVLADEDTDHAHGTFIGGLAAVGGALNGVETCPEPDGAELVDVAVFPDEAKAGAFASYYPEGLPQFFDEMANAVSDARARHGVRVFNMSLNVLQPTTPDRYSQHAARLDQIAEANKRDHLHIGRQHREAGRAGGVAVRHERGAR